MFKDFKAFLLKGNVIDMAVWFIFGAAFGTVIKSLVTNVVMPPIGLLLADVDFKEMFLPLDGNKYATLADLEAAGAPAIKYGLFINDTVGFFILGFVIFLIIRMITKMQKEEDEKPTEPTEDVVLLTEIRDIMKNEESYDSVKSKLVRYSRDIQGVLENTRVVILPTPSDASVLDIASLNESLFFEWYKAHKDVDYESRLVGTVLVWKIPLPVVFDGANSSKSLLPYVDFEEKSYVFNHESGKYERGEDAETELTPEIWHGVISPNTGSLEDDNQAIQDYFDKNHDFYVGQWVFDQERWVIDGQDTPAGETYEPQVFYYDQFRENEALQYQKYAGYEMYLQNIEDITYNRYSKELAKKVSDQLLWVQNADIKDLLIAVDPEFDISQMQNSIDASASSDILTKHITNNSTKKFLEIFNGSTLWEMRKHVYNAWRYNDGGGKVNMDMPPFLVSVLDQVSGEIIKNVNTSLETQITDIVQNGLSRKIFIPEFTNYTRACAGTHRAFYFWRIANNVTSARECSIYRGSTQWGVLVESNRAYNIENTDGDVQLCGAQMWVNGDGIVSSGISWYWGGNTPAALSGKWGSYTDFSISGNNLKWGIHPVFDVLWSKEIQDSSKIASPLDCFEEVVFIETQKKQITQDQWTDGGQTCVISSQAPVLWGAAKNWSCGSNNSPSPVTIDFETEFVKSWNNSSASCHIRTLHLDGSAMKTHRFAPTCKTVTVNTWGGGAPDGGGSSSETQQVCTCPTEEASTWFKSIPSHILHSSPTDREFWLQTRSLFTPSLPIDKDRYIDFIGAKWGTKAQNYGYQRIDFPQLFRVNLDPDEGLTLENTAQKVREHLDEVSAQINTVIQAASPSGLSWADLEIYNILKTGEYPSATIDLYTLLKNKPLEVFTLDNQSKEISYLDTLIFSIFWNNLDTVSSKYKFIFQEYLSNEFDGNDYAFHLPKAKKSYELAYMAAPGDAQNMYVKLDPEHKATHPYADTISKNIALQTTINTWNIGDPASKEGTFECAPPDGVDIFQWIPAIICWLKEMLPPTIKISSGGCGVDLDLSEDELEEIEACSIDKNKNGVNDCIEERLVWGSLKLLSDAWKYFYNSSGILVSEIFTKGGELARFDSNSYIDHNLAKVEIPVNPDTVFDGSNSQVIYDRDIPALATKEARAKASKYVSFSQVELRAHRGGVKTYFYTKGKDANIYFESSLETKDHKGNIALDLTSNTLKLQVRWDRILVSTYQVDGPSDYIADNAIIASHEANICIVDGGVKSVEKSSIEADKISKAKEKLLLMIHNVSKAGNTLGLNYPLSLELLYNDARVFYEQDLSSEDLESVYSLLDLTRSGRYEVHIRDDDGFHSYRVFDILSEKASKIETVLGTNVIETGGNISTHLLSILDRYDNAANGDIYSIDMFLSWGGLVFHDNGEDAISYSVVEWYKAFRLKSTSRDALNTLRIQVKDIAGKLIDEETHTLRTIDEIKVDFNLVGSFPKVGWESYSYNVEFLDKKWNLLTDLNSRVYFGINKIYGRALKPYVEVVGGKAQVSFQTSTLAAENIDVELQLEWGNDIYMKKITIFPELPIKVDLHLSVDKIEASSDSISILNATLKDRYNNDVFTDNSTKLDIEIHERSEDIISVDSSQKTVARWKTQFQISGTEIPGIWYFQVSSTPDLSGNSFELIGQAPFAKTELVIPTMVDAGGALNERGKQFYKQYSDSKYISRFVSEKSLTQSKAYEELPWVLQEQVRAFWNVSNSLTVNGLGKNAGSVETFFFWDSDDISGNSYNSMYSVLLGAPYGDTTQEDYLAGEILFDRDNSALAVSSLLSTPYKFHDIISFEQSGHIALAPRANITQDIELLPLFDSEGRLAIDIHNNALETYIGRAYYNLTDASDISLDIVGDAPYALEKDGSDAVIVSSTWKRVFKAYESWRFERKSGLSLSFDEDFVWEGISINLRMWAEIIAKLHIASELKVNVTRDEWLLQTKLAALQNTIVVHLSSNSYSSRSAYIDEDTQSQKIYYQDPFANKYTLEDFYNNDTLWFESSQDEAGIGWQDSNTMLLSFAAGESVWEASKNFQSFSLINLWDPVFSLKGLSQNFKNSDVEKSFDPTLGEIIEADDDLIGYQVFDYNADNREDIITIHRDGYIALYENDQLENRFIAQRNLVFAADGWSVRMVKTGDFSGDGYEDIFFVTESWEPALYNNHEKDFYRYDIAAQMSLSGAIIQAETFDMDSDGSDDIVTLDDAGEIHIFYGWGDPQSPKFTQKFIGDGYAISMSNTTTSHGWGVYYDGLIQLADERASDILRNSQEYLDSIQNGGEGGNPEFMDNSLVESFLYITLPYLPTGSEETLENTQIVEDSLWGDDDTVGDFLNNYEDYVSYSWLQNAYNTDTYFLRSQYADSEGIEVTKTFTDTTPPHLQTGDKVYYEISIKNTSNTRKNNIAYVDSIPKYFHFSSQDFTVLTQDNLTLPRKSGIAGYEILLDGFYLDPGEETRVRYELDTLPLSYWYMQVGLYEQWEVGDDIYGDIILKDDEQNCGRQADIYRSAAVRSYLAGTTLPSCESADIEVGNSFPELTDENENGVPDYLDDLLDAESSTLGEVIDGQGDISANSQALTDYGQEILEELGHDTDGDGIPDRDDTMDNTDSATDFMWALDSINESIDEISEDLDEIIEGLSCGFGGWSCIATPLNWAPLAPWSDPTLFGKPIWDGLKVGEGVPVFSALTWRQTTCGHSPCCLPSVYPATSATFIPGPFCGGPGAGGSKWINSPTNFVRMFATPTLTGGFGIAVCFWAPASVAGNANPKWAHPVVPGGNCIVAAMPLMSCEWGEWDPWVLWYPYPGNGFGLIHANCEWGTQSDLHTPLELESQFVLDYLSYLKTGVQPEGMYGRYVDALWTVANGNSWDYYLPSEPLINIGGWGDNSMSSSIDLDVSALGTGNFEDVVQIKNKRVGGFPSFLMGWVESQLDEITSKLTNLPKVFVILPDFGWIFDYSFDGFWDGLSEAFQDGKNESQNKRDQSQGEIDSLRAQKSTLDCSWADAFNCKTIDLKISQASGNKYTNSGKETLSWIREVYEFIGNIPLINLETETIQVNIPWIEPAEIDRFLVDWEGSLDQWKWQLSFASASWSWWTTCSGTAAEISACQSENDIKKKAYADVEAYVSSLEKNIQTLQEYKEFPDKLAELINIKEVWLEQILCNIEAISKLAGEWISSNGERFKAWVELYVLIKAILKSWQLFIDVFNDYEAECHECKNERHDLNDFTFQLVSAVIPSPPIIQFPKWPDIILDLHNIRAGMTVYMPDFDINMRPIVLPTLPDLSLPEVPSIGFSLPELPTLPSFELPELPELPSLPTVELPDLPPPPKIPKLFGAVEGVLNIGKLITKAMCILKGSPFVPEWRAGDQIAFLTERNGYLPAMDFIDIQPPAFSYSTISAIKVTTYVNLEFEMEFILEAIRSITAPLDAATNNIANMLDLSISDIDLSEAIPTDIKLDIELDGETQLDISLAPLDENPTGMLFIAGLISGKFIKLIEYMWDNVHTTMTNTEFKKYVWNQLADNSVTSNARTQDLRDLWSEVLSLSYSQEDTLISELQENSREKFQVLEDIISTEIEYSKGQRESLKNIKKAETVTQVSAQKDSRIESYNILLEPYNLNTLDAAIALTNGESQESQALRADLQKGGEELMNGLRGWLEPYKRGALLTAESGNTSSAQGWSCHTNSSYQYVYEGIYVLEDGKNYRLFDYTDLLRGDEEITLGDFDNDDDDDVLYLMNHTLYFKENRKSAPTKEYPTLPPLILSAKDNVFYNGDIYHEAINGFSEASVSDGAINIEFERPTNSEIKNFRMSYHTIVDRYLDESDDFIPQNIETHIVDAIADIDVRKSIKETTDYTIMPHLATLTYAGGMNGIKLTNDKLKNLRHQLEDNVLVTLTSGTHIYASDNDFEITYQLWGKEIQTLRVRKYQSIFFNTPAKILELSWDAYVSMGISEDIENTDIIGHIGMPLLPGAHIEFTGNENALDESSHIDIRYYDNSGLQMDMRDIKWYRLYDLGNTYERDYRIRLEVPNDFYYARIHGFKDEVNSTLSRQILLAPQIYSDTLAPQIGLTQKIRIPVYQKQKINLTPYIYEDGGLSGISEVRVDFDLTRDSDGDGNTRNDADTKNIAITKTPVKIEIEFWEYDTLFEKNIVIALVDDNGNIGSKEIGFEVYPPQPKIIDIENNTITGIIDEDLLDEPVRLYRYRGGFIEKLQDSTGNDLVETDIDGNYDFEASEQTDGLALSYSGSVVATIDEYTGRIDLQDALIRTKVFATNDPANESVYPEVQILRLATPLFRQFVKIPEGQVQSVSNFNTLEHTGIFMKLINQEDYASFRVSLGASYNPGSLSVYKSDDEDKRALMTIFKDGRIIIDLDNYRLEYRTLGEDASLVLVENTTGNDVAQVVYHMNASYVLR